MSNIKLNKSAATITIESYLAQDQYQKTKDSNRLRTIQSLLNEKGEAPLDQVLAQAFPKAKDPLNALSRTAKTIQQNAKAIGVQLHIKRDNLQKKELADRIVWIEGTDTQKERVLADTSAAVQQPPSEIRNRAKSFKRKIYLAACYAPKEKAKAIALIADLRACLGMDAYYDFILKDYITDLTVGGIEKEEKFQILTEADLIVVFESTQLHGAPFIKKYLLQQDEEGKEVVLNRSTLFPINFGLVGANSDRSRLGGLKQFEWEKKGQKRHYTALRGTNEKESYAHDLARALSKHIQLLDKQARIAGEQDRQFLEEKVFDGQKLEMHKTYVPNTVKKERLAGLGRQVDEGGDIAIELLDNWLNDPNSPPLFALLGQYGMGKTFTSRVFVQQQIQRFKEENSLFIPLYFDLRDFEQGLLTTGFDIWTIIKSILNRRKDPEEQNPMQVEDIKTILKQYPTLLVFDGLDEVIIHIGNQQLENHFLEEILKLQPYFQAKLASDRQTPFPRKMLLTCRTDYFKTLAKQTSFFQAMNRKHIDPNKDYACARILPFDEEQVKSYLKAVLPERNTEEVYGISQRPVLLDFLVEIVDDLETLLLQKKIITTATIYERLILKNFERDGEKHEIPTEIKLYLLEEIAAYLWKRSSRRMEFDKLASFLAECLGKGTEQMKKVYYQKDEDTLGKDLRNATLLVRSNEQEFSFSHKSFQEYFLAKYLLRHLSTGNYTALDIANINKAVF